MGPPIIFTLILSRFHTQRYFNPNCDNHQQESLGLNVQFGLSLKPSRRKSAFSSITRNGHCGMIVNMDCINPMFITLLNSLKCVIE